MRGVWRLCRGDEVLGEITIGGSDFPWLTGTFAPTSAFAEVAPLFAEELALCEVLATDDSEAAVEAWEKAYGRISDVLTLAGPDGPAAFFLLHIDGDRAWFRWDDGAVPGYLRGERVSLAILSGATVSLGWESRAQVHRAAAGAAGTHRHPGGGTGRDR